MTRSEFNAMGTTVVARGSDPNGVRAVFEELESVFSRFLPDSELSRLNARTSTGSRSEGIPVSARMASVLEEAMLAYERSGGLVDVGVGAAVEAWGYDVTYANIRPRPEEPGRIAPGGWYTEGGRVWLAPGTRLDLGGIAKGWSVDHVVESGLATIVSAGGDLRSDDPSLVVDVEDAPGDIVASVHVGVGALATSSIGRRRWRVSNRVVHHIIDPTAGQPANSPVRTACVVAETAAAAETGAKALILHGVDGLAWADRQPWIRQALAVWHDGSVYATARGRVA